MTRWSTSPCAAGYRQTFETTNFRRIQQFATHSVIRYSVWRVSIHFGEAIKSARGARFTRSHGPEECRRPRLSAPHLGYVTREALIAFYADTLEAVLAFANGAPIRVANPDALAHRKKS